MQSSEEKKVIFRMNKKKYKQMYVGLQNHSPPWAGLYAGHVINKHLHEK